VSGADQAEWTTGHDARRGEPPGVLEIVHGPNTTQRWVATGETVVLGSEPGVEVELPDPNVSSHQLMIERLGPGWQVRPLAGAAPTYLVDATGRAYPLEREIGIRSGEFLVGPYQVRLYPPA
jgi:hypothetical protein